MGENQDTLIFMVALVCLPCIPSVIFYKWMNSTGSAEGPLAGLGVKFGGAAALYVVLFLALLALRPTADVHYHTWTVSGAVAFDRAAGDPDPNVNDIFVRFVPPRLGVYNDGAFTWDIPVVEDANGLERFPDLQVDLRGYAGATIALDGSSGYGAQKLEFERDPKTKRIRIKTPIVLRSQQASRGYVAAPAEVPQPVAPPPVATAGGAK